MGLRTDQEDKHIHIGRNYMGREQAYLYRTELDGRGQTYLYRTELEGQRTSIFIQDGTRWVEDKHIYTGRNQRGRGQTYSYRTELDGQRTSIFIQDGTRGVEDKQLIQDGSRGVEDKHIYTGRNQRGRGQAYLYRTI